METIKNNKALMDIDGLCHILKTIKINYGNIPVGINILGADSNMPDQLRIVNICVDDNNSEPNDEIAWLEIDPHGEFYDNNRGCGGFSGVSTTCHNDLRLGVDTPDKSC